MRNSTRLLIVVLIQSLVLVGMIAKRQWTLNTGTPVVLETQPVDPRSLFRGDYVTFNYAISQLRLDQLAGDKDFQRHDTVYVVLAPGDPYWHAVAVYHAKPEPAAGQVALKGEVQYVNERWWNRSNNESVEGRNITVRYGIEDYFIPEGEGRQLERPRQQQRVSLRVAVDRYGNGAIQGLLIDGVERYRETLF